MGIEESIEIGLREGMLPFRNLNDALHHTTALGTALGGILPQAAEVFYLLEKEQSRHSFPNVHVMKDFAQKMEMFWLGAARKLSPRLTGASSTRLCVALCKMHLYYSNSHQGRCCSWLDPTLSFIITALFRGLQKQEQEEEPVCLWLSAVLMEQGGLRHQSRVAPDHRLKKRRSCTCHADTRVSYEYLQLYQYSTLTYLYKPELRRQHTWASFHSEDISRYI